MNSVAKMPYAVKFGLALGIIGMILSIISNLSGLTESPKASAISIPIMLAIYFLIFYLAFKAYRTDNKGMSLGDALGLGALISVISGVLSGLFNLVYTKFIDPGMMDRMMEAQYEAMEGYGLSEEQIEQRLEMGQMLASNPVFGVAMAILGALCFGFIISLILGAIMKRDTSPDWLNEH